MPLEASLFIGFKLHSASESPGRLIQTQIAPQTQNFLIHSLWGPKNCLSNKFPADAAGAVATFWVPQLRWSSFTRWKTKWSKKTSKLPSIPQITTFHLISFLPVVARVIILKYELNLYRTLELGCPSAPNFLASFRGYWK